MEKLNKATKIILVVVTCIVVLCYLSTKFTIIKSISNSNSEQVIIGIIDAQLSTGYDNVVTNSTGIINSQIKTHGDRLISFANKYCPSLKIYYYDATNDNGSVDTNGLLSGLKWMKNKGVKHINISMSSNIFSDDLQNFIEENDKDIKIYASYHNLEQTLDYPAMYKYVIASGKKSRIAFKANDIQYKSNNIVLLSNGIKKYSGNSFLSIMTTINDIISK
ncbi:S8/S53 family peptidase [Alkaliphilus hydrothermalis]|uniref:Peptidase S8/S53 domain-containing protein n=1 Tax=Alkaliphilus hydrothermalis TaxID=1482730 RepID=A0ABS2NRB6_9FIRM|nr:hypothetical protein [Alkaliphilus hydrothermalis]MBM7615494.1 hypothetical protein [Alkaliphilus hydrothermalis]